MDTKHLKIYSLSETDCEKPKVYLDWFYLKANLKCYYKSEDIIHIRIKLFSKLICIDLLWNFQERPMNEEEKEMKKRLNKLFEEINNETR